MKELYDFRKKYIEVDEKNTIKELADFVINTSKEI